MSPLYLTYLNAPRRRGAGADRRRDPRRGRGRLAAQGRGETVIEPRVHLVPDPTVPRAFQRAARRFRAPLDLAGVKVVGDYVDNYKHGLPSEMGLLNLFDPGTGVPLAIIDASHLTDMRTGAVTAIGAKHLARKGIEGARPYRRARHGLLERAPARPAVRLRRDPRAFAPAGEPRRLRRSGSSRDLGKPVTATAGLARLRRGRRHRRRGLAADRARADAEDRMDQAGRLRRALRHDERGRAVAHRHHGQDRRRRLGPVQEPASSARCARMSRPASSREATLHAELGEIVAGHKAGPRARRRDDPVLASRPVALATSRWAARCSTRRRGSASASGCAMRDAGARPARRGACERPPQSNACRVQSEPQYKETDCHHAALMC